MRAVPVKHPQHCGPLGPAVTALDPDLILCVGIRHGGNGQIEDYQPFANSRRVMAIGPDIENFENLPGLELAVLADERRTLARLQSLIREEGPERYDQRRGWARTQASQLRETRRQRFQAMAPQPSQVRPLVLAETLDQALERRGGGLVMIEQFALPLDCLEDNSGSGNNVYIRPAGGSEGYGIGGAAGLKLAAPDKTVVGLVGDGSVLYADSGLWTAVHHAIPVLYVVPDNRSYGIVANYFGLADGVMKQTSEYAGVVLDGVDLVQIAAGFGLQGTRVEDESCLEEAIEHGLQVVEDEQRPFLLDVHLPLGLPAGGQAATQFQLAASTAGAER
jgi:thiamine pyrophosphate-dependent acetolactate synthase large subunit-like protein